MAGAKDVILHQFETSKFLIDKLTADLSDEEYFRSPTDKANHAAWIVGHIASSEDWVTAILTGTERRIPDSTRELFRGGSACRPDPSIYPSRKEIDTMFRDARTRAVEAVLGFDETRWSEASPEDAAQAFPTLGTLCSMLGFHPFWHIGQLTMCRAALGKPGVLG